MGKTTAGTGKGASVFETLRRIKGSGMLVDKKDEVQKKYLNAAQNR
jgi:hypothetical protein